MTELEAGVGMDVGAGLARLTIAEIETIPLRVPLGRTYQGSRYKMTHRSTIPSSVWIRVTIVDRWVILYRLPW